MLNILFICTYRPDSSPGQRFRFEQYLEYLRDNGFNYKVSFLLSEEDEIIFYKRRNYLRKIKLLIKMIRQRINDVRLSNNFDLVFIYREALPIWSIIFERKFFSN